MYTPTPEPFECDGAQHVVGTISGADGFEIIDFTSAGSDRLRSGSADGLGELEVNWTCDPDEVGEPWTVQATGQTSRRNVSFTIRGERALPGRDGPIDVELRRRPLHLQSRAAARWRP